MHRLFRFFVVCIAAISLVTVIVSALILANFTAPNPTGRRYASAAPLRVGSSQDIGSDAENILSGDLGVPRNGLTGERKCICNIGATPNRQTCNVCVAQIAVNTSSAYFRIPDFVTDQFMAESKNTDGLLYTGSSREVSQIQDYVTASLLMRVPLYVYTRVETPTDPRFVTLVESTGGAVVPYFQYAGYVDPADATAWKMVALATFCGTASLWSLTRRGRPEKPRVIKPPRRPAPAHGPADFLKQSKERAQRKIDEYDVKLKM